MKVGGMRNGRKHTRSSVGGDEDKCMGESGGLCLFLNRDQFEVGKLKTLSITPKRERGHTVLVHMFPKEPKWG